MVVHTASYRICANGHHAGCLLTPRNLYRWQLWLNYFLIVFGLVGAVVGVADSAYRLLHGDV